MNKYKQEDEHVLVQYIGKRDVWVDRKYTGGLTFTKWQKRSIPAVMAGKMLRHTDLFAEFIPKEPVLAEDQDEADQGQPEQDDSAQDQEQEQEHPEVDDTEQLLKESQELKDDEDEIEQELQSIRDEIYNMDKEALEHFAFTRYEQKINKRRSVENLRQEVIGLVDQYGAV